MDEKKRFWELYNHKIETLMKAEREAEELRQTKKQSKFELKNEPNKNDMDMISGKPKSMQEMKEIALEYAQVIYREEMETDRLLHGRPQEQESPKDQELPKQPKKKLKGKSLVDFFKRQEKQSQERDLNEDDFIDR